MRGNRAGYLVLFCCLALRSSSLLAQSELVVDGDVEAATFTGDGSNLTNVPISGGVKGYFEYACPSFYVCFVVVNCPAGKYALSGGLELPGITPEEKWWINLNDTFPKSDTQWEVTASNYSPYTRTYRAWVTCVPADAAPAAPVNADLEHRIEDNAHGAQHPHGGTFLMCPKGDHSIWVGRGERQELYCENHPYLPLQASGGRTKRIPVE